jgi:hypothetical protein
LSVFLVPHTHWDREWYRPFQSFRISLVDVVDQVLELLEADERMRFTLDGQLATVDDYLEIRPEAEERLRALVRSGRLAIGPWYTLMDEFLVSGESIVRNLELGLARAEELGGAMQIGYLPDSFGHIAQMPQILRRFGIQLAVVWRGVPEAIDRHAFAWEAPDGSIVRAEYLPDLGYSNAADAFPENRRGEELKTAVERLRPWFGDEIVLGMVGTDHMPPVRDLVSRVSKGTRIGTLSEYLTSAETDGLRRWQGELRSAARANLLPNVVSARIDLKQACARAERALTRYAEPLYALYGDHWPAEFLHLAWTRVLQNAAHDSICGCSADDVSAQVLVRYAEAEQIAGELTSRALARLSARAPSAAIVVVNPSPQPRTDLIEFSAPVPDEWGEVALETPSRGLLPTQRTADGTLIANVPAPALGWTSVRPVNRATGVDAPVEADGTILRNSLVELDLSSLRLVDGGDLGDSYNYAPPERDTVVGEPSETSLEVLEAGPLRVCVVERRTYRWPCTLEVTGKSRTGETISVPVEIRGEIRAGEPFVRIRVAFENRCDDHRVRVHVPLPDAADRTYAEGQFAVIERPRSQEGGYGEHGLGAYPASAFVAAGGVALLFEHVSEYELVGERELAITILRSVGLISRIANPYRKVNAGPELPIPAAQMHGQHRFWFAWCSDPERALAHAERYRHPFVTAAGTGLEQELREEAGPLRTSAVLASLRVSGGRREARIANQAQVPSVASFGSETVELRPWEIRTLRLAATDASLQGGPRQSAPSPDHA